MIHCLATVLSESDIAAVKRDLAGARFEDGRRTAGWHARLVKHNEQKARSDDNKATEDLVLERLRAHPVFQAAALPRAIRPPLIARYTAGMAYDAHVDDAIMGAGAAMLRSDIAVTVFLAAPQDYAGGELVVDDSAGEQAYKLDAGAAVIYPATTLHRVEPVTEGARLVAVTWVQSLVRDAARREILFDLDTARRSLFEENGKTPAFDLLSKSYANLLRRWAEP